jgi:hypothetical protein
MVLMLSEQQQDNLTTIEDIVCFVVHLQKYTEGIYYAYDVAQQLLSQGKKYNYTFKYMNQVQIYSGCQIVQLYNQTTCASLNDLLGDSNNLDGVIKVFFKLRIPFTKLYGAYYNALSAKNNQAYSYFYTFLNPFYGQSNAGNLSTIEEPWKMNRDCIIRTFQCCILPFSL